MLDQFKVKYYIYASMFSVNQRSTLGTFGVNGFVQRNFYMVDV